MEKELSKIAKEGLEWGANEIKVMLDCGIEPKDALDLLGVKGLTDTTLFFNYLRDTNRNKTLKRLIFR